MFDGFKEWWDRLWNREADKSIPVSIEGMQFLEHARKDYQRRHPTEVHPLKTKPKRAVK